METSAKNSFDGMNTSVKTAVGGIALVQMLQPYHPRQKLAGARQYRRKSTAMAGMKKHQESTMRFPIWSKIKNTNDDVETNSKTNWGNSANASINSSQEPWTPIQKM